MGRKATTRQQRWRERNADAHRKYMRNYMREARAKKAKERKEAARKKLKAKSWPVTEQWAVRIGKRWGNVDALTAAWLMSTGAEVRLA